MEKETCSGFQAFSVFLLRFQALSMFPVLVSGVERVSFYDFMELGVFSFSVNHFTLEAACFP
jgi:hypothetical protein